MNKKLPNINKINNKITANKKKTYYSFNNERQEKNINEVIDFLTEENFFKYFNRNIEITLSNDSIIKTKILSKIDNKILLEDGTYLDLGKIKNIK